MNLASNYSYLESLVARLWKTWPENQTVNLVFHGHSVPAGYFATPRVQTFDAYPHLLHLALKTRFPDAVVNALVTAVGGENAEGGAARFEQDVLTHRPDLITLDYSLNDRGLGLERAAQAWRAMIEAALERKIPVLLLTPTPEAACFIDPSGVEDTLLRQHAQQVRDLSAEYGVGLVDSLSAFDRHAPLHGGLENLLSWVNHPNRAGHELVARELLRWFPITAQPLSGGST